MKKPSIIFIMTVMLFFVPNMVLAGSLTGSPTINAPGNDVAASMAGAGAEANNNQTFEASDAFRPFANSGGANFPAIPSFFGPDTPGPTYQRVEFILPLKSEWKRYELDVSIIETDIMFRCRYFLKTRKTLIKELNSRTKSDFFDPLKSSLKEKPGDTIHIITAPPKGKFKMIGHITLWAEDKYTTSFELMGKACLLAMKLPTAKSVLIMSQGCEKKVETSGWGIGVNHTTATISDSQSSGTVNSGGTGYSSGEAGNTGRPWLQVAIIQ